jgi:hypothetical protein
LKAVATDANGLSRTSLVNGVEVAYPPVANATTLGTPKATPIDIDLQTLVSDVETPLASLKLQLGNATNGTVTMLPDGHTARFTPAAGYSGPAGFNYTVIDTTRDDRTLLNYAFQDSDVTDSSGQGRDATLNVQGTGTANYATNSPLTDYTKSIALTENGTAGAVRIERSLTTGELDLATGDWTLSGWFKRNPSTNIDVIAQLGNSGSFGPSALTLAFYGSGSTLELRNFTSGNTQDIGLSKTNVANNAWHHFTIVRSGSEISWYHNGVLVGSDNTFVLAFSNSQPVKFGGSGGITVPDRWLNGSLADLAVFGAALPPADITRLTTQPVHWFGGQNAGAGVVVNVWSDLESWRFAQFGTTNNTHQAANEADWDADGYSNFMEFAMGTDPKFPTHYLVGVEKAGPQIRFTYQRSRAAMGEVSHIVEWSDSLAPPWSAEDVTERIVSDNGIIQNVEATMPAGSAGCRFVRLRAAGN